MTDGLLAHCCGVGGREAGIPRQVDPLQHQQELGHSLLGQLILDVHGRAARSNNLVKDRFKPVLVVHNPFKMQFNSYPEEDGVKPVVLAVHNPQGTGRHLSAQAGKVGFWK